jgi:hypothetical protein
MDAAGAAAAALGVMGILAGGIAIAAGIVYALETRSRGIRHFRCIDGCVHGLHRLGHGHRVLEALRGYVCRFGDWHGIGSAHHVRILILSISSDRVQIQVVVYVRNRARHAFVLR